jgi:RNA polymerase sigma factor (sigma-70 family)
MNDSLEAVLVRLNSGEQSAVEEMFVAFEPYMRMAIHRRIAGSLRAKFDSADVVQSVWADLVDGLRESRWVFASIEQFRAFLIKMTRNRLIDRLRSHRHSLDHEIKLPLERVEALPADRIPRVSEDVYADELWQQMVEACPAAHYELLTLKHQGASIAEIAERTKLHEGSVRRILYDIAKRVAARREREVSGEW